MAPFAISTKNGIGSSLKNESTLTDSTNTAQLEKTVVSPRGRHSLALSCNYQAVLSAFANPDESESGACKPW